MGLSARAYAKHRSVSHVAVLKAIKAGRIALEADGKIDPVHADAAWSQSSDPAKSRTKPTRATALVFRLGREERDSWINWPARVAAQMAADLGVPAHAVQTQLESYVRTHLAELGQGIAPDFR